MQMQKISVRFDDETMRKIADLSKASNMKQSDVVRSLVKSSLTGHDNFSNKLQSRNMTDKEKKMLYDVGNLMRNVTMELKKIGVNINVRRKDFNTKKKAGAEIDAPDFIHADEWQRFEKLQKDISDMLLEMSKELRSDNINIANEKH